VEGGLVEGGLVERGMMEGGLVDGVRVEGGLVDGGLVDGGLVEGGLVEGGLVDGGLVEGGLVDGRLVDGGLVDGGLVDGGLVEEGQQGTSSTEEQEHEENNLLVSSSLGFAKTRGKDFWPARRIGELGTSLVRVQFFGTGVVAVVALDCWVGYTEEVEKKVSKAESSATFAAAMQEMMAAKARVERDGEEELDFVGRLHEASTKPRQPAVKRQLSKLNRVDLQHSEQLTAAAFRDYIVETEGLFTCRDCPAFKTPIKVIAKRHARNHGQPKKADKRPAGSKKKFTCSKPGCGEKFALVSKCDKHYRESHQIAEGGYKCWSCSTPTKQAILKNWKQYVQHMRATKIHNPSAGQELECPYCDDMATSTNRSFNLKIHIRRHHGPLEYAKAMLSEILDTIFEEPEEEEEAEVDEVEAMETEQEVEGERVDKGSRQKGRSSLDLQIEALENIPNLCEYEVVKLNNLKQQKQMLLSLNLEGEEQVEEEVPRRRRVRKRPLPQPMVIRRSGRLQVASEVEENANKGDEESNEEDEALTEDEEALLADDEELEMDCEEVPTNAGDAAKRFLCGLCGYGCMRGRRLQEHIEDVHTKRVRKIPCTRCVDAVFDTWFEMIEHRRTCILRCIYPDCPWTHTERRKVAPHNREHLTKLRRMQ
jgi:hypothetical protein